ncbi:MAG: hypothetical protein QOH21_3015 [Acidobacteriota bacterium]|jgi:hypothetical protein|nr:hypothetical protein [Acidobacteriota bacterium]
MTNPWKAAVLAVVFAACGGTATMPPPNAAVDRPTAELTRTDAAATLRPDAFDAAAPIAVAEAAKSAAGVPAPSPEASHQHEHARGAPAAVLYTCPMHPEVTSATPGTCPKCGMTLVKKESKP